MINSTTLNALSSLIYKSKLTRKKHGIKYQWKNESKDTKSRFQERVWIGS